VIILCDWPHQAQPLRPAGEAEKGSAQAALSDLQAQTKSAQSQLDEINNELGRASTLAGISREITAASKKLKGTAGRNGRGGKSPSGFAQATRRG
jgi:hypothetical protein